MGRLRTGKRLKRRIHELKPPVGVQRYHFGCGGPPRARMSLAQA
jgi:hypothetical protein